jgi:hypothetical protein
MLRLLITGLILIALLAEGSAQADSVVVAVPRQKYFKGQFAGNIGLVSAGLGREFSRRFNADINLGYLSKEINGARVFTVSFRPAWDMFDFVIGEMNTELYLGAGINYSMGRKIYGKIPDYYPQDYYWPNAFHFNPFAGLRLGSGKSRVKIFAELGTVEYMIWFAWKNRHVSIPDILNLALGFTVDVPGSKKSLSVGR